MRANISIDVSLLAIVLAMYFTKQDNRMILVLVAALVSHVIITSEIDEHNDDSTQIYHVGAGTGGSDDQGGPVDVTGVTEDTSSPGDTEETITHITPERDTFLSTITPKKQFKTTVSSGVFERTISTPQTQLTSAIFPSSSSEANGKLANARGSFFETLVS